MPIIYSDDTLVSQAPEKFKMNEPSKLLTPIKGEPPVNAGRGRRTNPVVNEIYTSLLTNRNQWFHVNIPLTSNKQLASLRISLYNRAKKDNMSISTTSVFNDKTKMFDLWVMLTA